MGQGLCAGAHGPGPWARAHVPGPMGQGPWAGAHGPGSPDRAWAEGRALPLDGWVGVAQRVRSPLWNTNTLGKVPLGSLKEKEAISYIDHHGDLLWGK